MYPTVGSQELGRFVGTTANRRVARDEGLEGVVLAGHLPLSLHFPSSTDLDELVDELAGKCALITPDLKPQFRLLLQSKIGGCAVFVPLSNRHLSQGYRLG